MNMRPPAGPWAVSSAAAWPTRTPEYVHLKRSPAILARRFNANGEVNVTVGSTPRRISASAILLLACGCFPAVTHGARIEEGWIGGIMAGTTSGDTHVEGDEGGIHLRQAAIGPFFGFGSASSRPTEPGYYLGAVVPLFFPAAQVDAYLQLPPIVTGPAAAGVGVTASAEGTHGYGMLGADFNRMTSWYVAGGYGSRRSSSSFQTTSPAWFGNAGIIIASGYLRTQLFAQFATGRIPGSCFNDPGTQTQTCSLGEHARALSAGISLGRQQHNARITR